MTGRSTGQWMEDKATTARVKTALATKDLGTLTRIDVDTIGGMVHLTGMVDRQERIREIMDLVRNVTDDNRTIVSQLAVTETGRVSAPAVRR